MPSTSSTSNARVPSWYRDADALGYPDECRAKCSECRGHGSPYYFEVVQCLACTRGPNNIPCPAHVCRTCRGSGFVCPKCRGMRFVRSEVFSVSAGSHQSVRELLRCPACTEGNNINPVQERNAIDAYLFRFRHWQAQAAAAGEELIEPSIARQMAEDAEICAQQTAFEAGQQDRQRTRQKRRISRSKAVEARIDAGLPPSPIPTEQEWAALHTVVGTYRRAGKQKERAE